MDCCGTVKAPVGGFGMFNYGVAPFLIVLGIFLHFFSWRFSLELS